MQTGVSSRFPAVPSNDTSVFIELPSHQSAASSSVMKNLSLIFMTKKLKKKKKNPSGLSVHPQPRSGANLTVCGFSAPQFTERLRELQDRTSSERAALLFFLVWFQMQLYTVGVAERVLAGVTDIIRRLAKGLSACGWRWRRNAVEITAYLSLPSPFVLGFFFSSVSSSDLASFSAEFWPKMRSMK